MPEPIACPLCRRSKTMRKAKPLYGTDVCLACYHSFANRRQLAYVIDWVVWTAGSVLLLGVVAAGLATTGASEDVAAIVILLASYIGFPLIFFCKDGFSGHSLGKLALGVRVVDRDTCAPIGFGTSLKRNLPLLIPVMPIVIAFLLLKGYRLGDGWARTKVIWKRYANHGVFTGGLSCEQCQYDLTGNSSGTCPECGVVTSKTVRGNLAA